MPKIDFRFESHGSLTLLTPCTPAAREWMEAHLPVHEPETQFWGKALVIEPRYAQPILDGILLDGLEWR